MLFRSRPPVKRSRQQGITPAVIPGMTAVALPIFPQIPARRPRRFAFALAGSGLLHLMVAAGLTLETAQPGAPPSTAAPIYVRLELEGSLVTPAGLPPLDAQAPPAEPKDKQHATVPEKRGGPAPAPQRSEERRVGKECRL